MYSIRYVRVGRLRYGAVHTSWNPPWFAGITLFILRRKDMLYNKRPLIYIPKKKKIESAPAPTPVTADAAIRVLTQYLKYPNTQSINNWQHPAKIIYNPTMNPFSIGGKSHTAFMTDGWGYSTYIVPIVELSSSSSDNMVTVANAMRWTHIAPAILTATIGWSMSYAFFIGSSSPFGSVVIKIKDSTPTQTDPYELSGVMIDDEAIPGMTTPQFNYCKLVDPNHVIGRIRIALNNAYGSSTGTLIFIDRDFTLWNNATLLSFANYYAARHYGTKTTVADLLI